MIILFTVMLLVLLAIGLPVGFALGTGGLVGMLLFMGGDGTLNQIPLLAYKSLDDFVLCAVPLYVMMSQILLEGKVGNDLFELGNKWLRHLPGGLGAATIVACGIFAAITGSSAACAVTIGAIAIPEMLKRNYERTVVLGAVAAGGTLGILIPPSIPMILYGAITGESIGQLFMGGLVPGILLGVALMIMTAIIARKRNYPKGQRYTPKEFFKIFKDAFLGLMTCLIIVGGVASVIGFATAGSIADRIGRKWTISTGLAVTVVAMIVMCFVAPTGRVTGEHGEYAFPVLLFAVWAIKGFGMALVHNCSFPMVVELCSSKKIGRFTGFYYAASMSAQTITPIALGLVLNGTMAWRTLPIYAAVLTAGSLAVFAGLVKNIQAKKVENVKGLEALAEVIGSAVGF